MLRIAVLNRAEYEFAAHLPFARTAGASDTQLSALRQKELDFSVFSDDQRAVLRYADAMTLDVQVSESIVNDVNKEFNAQGLLEITVIVAGYNMVSRVLEALTIPHDP